MDNEALETEKQLWSIRHKLRNKFSKYLKTMNIIGSLGAVYFLVIGRYWIAFLLWLAFFPDINEWIKMVKRYFYSSKN